jgi:hypothetical protein
LRLCPKPKDIYENKKEILIEILLNIIILNVAEQEGIPMTVK